MLERARKTFPRRAVDLWLAQPNGSADLLSDRALMLNHYRLNSTATFVWQRCDGRQSAWEIAEELVHACGQSAPSIETVAAHVLAILEELREYEAIEWPPQDACDILLVQPPFPSVYSPHAVRAAQYSAPPLGLAYIASVLREAGFSVTIADLHLEAAAPEDLVRICRALEPKVVGLTATTPTYSNALRAARHVKAWNPDTITVIGGVHGSALPEDCLATGAFDYVVLGEGEVTFLELVRELLAGRGSTNEIRGIALRDHHKGTVITPLRPPILDLDSLPLPARDLLAMNRYVRHGSISTSRGCPLGCMFCACNIVFGHRYRTHSVERMIDEIEHLGGVYGINEIDFNDDTFNWAPERVFAFCEKVRDRGLHIRWSCFCRAAQMTDEMALAMRRAGCSAIQYGVESGSAHILSTMGKKTDLRQIETAVRAAGQAAIQEVACGIIIGHPDDTVETVRETLDFAEHLTRIGATRIMLSLLTPYPGTKAFLEAERLGLRFVKTDWEEYTFSRVIVETQHLSKEELRMLYVEGLLRFLDYEEKREPR